MRSVRGFTVIELVVVIVFAAAATLVLLYQRTNIEASQRDNDRKTAINAMYYNLESAYYEKNGHYPTSINEKNLTAMDPALFKDPGGIAVGEAGSDYVYEPVNCENDKCQSYRLSSRLDKEADYIKTSRNN